ncbi:hypothetical protein COR50_09305 [Chitinophaga caeni]|uniref:PKD domain-containing protein n=1 Tax=Chitinophaga caeni TaxID=2029983 RepID=A0A291QTR0_9BACT|nr:PKD domain-containing protein [Chitinophaga caeni]ATL47350.1 hypothetical protein COR50_09305 [Chitinophaga caeni]
MKRFFTYILLGTACCLLSLITHAQTVDFTADKWEGCEPLTVKFTNLTDPSAIAYNWDFSLGANASDRDVDKIFGIPNIYNVTLTATFPGGVQRSVSKTITVYANPLPLFSVSGTLGCTPYQVNFEDQSQAGSGSITRIVWDYGDGVTEEATSPTHTYQLAGSFPVSNIVTNSYGCVKGYTLPDPIVVNETPRIDFSADDRASCTAPLTVDFISSGPAAANYTWDFGDPASGTSNTSTLANPSHSYNQPGLYTVTLTATTASGCTSQVTKYHYVTIQQPTVDFDIPANICSNNPITFTNTTNPNPTIANWQFGDGTSSQAIDPTKTYSSPGDYVITLESGTPGCTQVITRDVHVEEGPVASFHATPQIGCEAPFTTQFNYDGTGATGWLWSFGDGATSTLENPNHTYNQLGTYDVTLTVTNANGCTNTLSLPGYIQVQEPEVNFTMNPPNGCIPLPVTFTPNMVVGGPVQNYLWNFGDGNTSNEANPTHTYTSQGIFTVNLTVTTVAGCTASFTSTVQAGEIPIVAFEANPTFTCANLPVQFTNLSVPRGTAWTWIFPQDNSTENIENPSHTFNTLGYHDVTLIVDNFGCIRELTKLQYINILPPIADFDFTRDCSDKYLVQFNDLSQFGPNPPVRNWHWDFGDGATSTDQSPVHTYTNPGSYTVHLTVDNGACTNEHELQVTIIDENATITVNNNTVCAGNEIEFTYAGIDAGNIATFSWDWGDGTRSTSTQSPVSKSYAQPGNYTVQLTITDDNGCVTASNSLGITVNGAMADFSFIGRNCVNDAISFTDLSITTHGNTITNWTWDFGDGSPTESTSTRPVSYSHAFSQGGNFNVNLIVEDASGCTVSSQHTVNVVDLDADFSADHDSTCIMAPVLFTPNTVNNSITYNWDFGDGTTSTEATPRHHYAAPGDYTVRLIMTNNNGCSDNREYVNMIHISNPQAQFSIPTDLSICPPIQIDFINESTDYKRVEWNFGDGSNSLLEDPSHIYTRPGDYTITLTVYSAGDCPAVYSQDIHLRGPTGSMQASPKDGCEGLEVNFSANSTNATTYTWDFDNGTVQTSTTPNITYQYKKAGRYVPRVLLTDAQGCTVLATGSDTITVDNVEAKFNISMPNACDSATILFEDQSSSYTLDSLSQGLTYTWDFGDLFTHSDSSSQQNPAYFFPRPGTYTVSLTATSSFGCQDTVTDTISIDTSPEAIIDPVNPACGGDFIQFTGHDQRQLPNTTYQWIMDGVPTYTEQQTPPVEYTQPRLYDIALIVTNENGTCHDTANLPFRVNPGVTLQAAPRNISICRGEFIAMLAQTNANQISWTDYNINDPQLAMPVANPDIDTVYYVTATNDYGCTKTDSVRVSVSQPFTVQASDVDICEGESAQLQASGAVSYSWSPASSLSNSTIPDPVAHPIADTRYTVIGYGSDNCFTARAEALVRVHPTPKVNLGPDLVIPAGNPYTLQANGNDIANWEWSPSTDLSCTYCSSTVLTPRSDQTISVRVSSIYGCEASDEVNVKIICQADNIFVPNTFSPNGDGRNDIFYPRGRGIRAVKIFRVFNRWGQMVFERSNVPADDPTYGWDGKYNGKSLEPDVFVYYLELICDTGENFVMKGNVTVLR